MFPWGWVADKYKKRREILQVAIISTAASALLVVSVQPEHHKCVEILGEAENKTYPVSLGSGFSRFCVPFEPCRMSESKMCVGKTPTTQNKTVQYQMDYGDKNELNSMFTLILVLTILGQIVGCGLASFPEALLVAHLEEKINKFGAIRLWGNLGEAVASFAVGASIKATEKQVCGQTLKNYSIAFNCFAGIIAAALITSFWLKVRYREPPQQDSSLRNIVAHAGTVKTILLVVVAAFVGVFIGMNKGIFLSGTLIELIGIRPTYQSYAVVALLLFVPMLVAC